jgi:preprotein translocase subunit YajC
MSFLMSNAMAAAQTAPASPADGSFSLIMIGAIFVLFYFMLIRPQNKRAKDHRELISKIKKGDEVITSGGILAKVSSVDDQYIKVAIAEGVEISLQRNSVSTVLPKGTLKSI